MRPFARLSRSARDRHDLWGTIYYGILALVEEDETRRYTALAEGQALLATNVIAPNHLLFRKDAIDACLSLRDWDGAERHGAALEDFVRPEPMPWSTFIIIVPAHSPGTAEADGTGC